MKKLNIVFMGTPDFSVPALQSLAVEKNFEISLVITQPDRPKGRGKKLTPPPIKAAAQELGLEIIQPDNINSEQVINQLKQIKPDFFVVVAFGQILSEEVLAIPAIYPVNIHASILPKYRGASPIQAAILNMDEETGITTMVMEKGLDSGDILLVGKTKIGVNDTAQDLHDKLAAIGADLIVETINQVVVNKIIPVAQEHNQASFSKLLKKNDGKIDWSKPSCQIIAHINAMTPWPGAFSYLENKRIKIFKIEVLDKKSEYKPGTVYLCDNEGIHVASGDNTILILELMGASGKRMTAQEYLRGNKIEEQCVFYL